MGDRDRKRAYMKRYQRQQRLSFIQALGGKCVECSNDDPRVLQFDHIEPVLNSRNRGTRRKDYQQSIDNDNLQLLCANCHNIKTWHSEED